MGAVVTLPTAAARPVRQRHSYGTLPAARRRELKASGRLADHPAFYRSPEVRERSARVERYADAGLTRSAPAILAGLVLSILTPEQQSLAMARLTLLADGHGGDDGLLAALEYARQVIGGRQ